ncbi:DUF4405 domain-containing protein [Haloferula sp. A504]|uniref:DUF4405 domain-containing protein n=1 Tax=Haloferula sp. A504 TaxID=3373601 RepID=UPI0031C82762|nr:DUF4405 domain-containing protein [Verrucomicrobiaceae bacterium E54]
MAKRNLGTLRRRSTSLFISLTFLVMAVTGVLAFVRPFSITIIGLHSLMGFLFIGIVGLHVLNNFRPLRGYAHGRAIWVALIVTGALTALFYFQPAPVKSVLGLSRNLGPALDRFEMEEDHLIYRYSPADHYRMALTVKAGTGFDPQQPPAFAIWLENQGAYHIKTLHEPDMESAAALPYWKFKRAGWEKAKQEAEEKGEVDLVSSPTPNGSFDPADYILPADPETSTPYKLLIEINQPGDAHGPYDDQPSLVYAVEIDELLPLTFQTLDLVGYPKREDEDGKEAWSLYYVDDTFGSALDLIDSALLKIERGEP